MSVEELTGVLLLSTKYAAPRTRNWCISALQKLFPTNLNAWDQTVGIGGPLARASLDVKTHTLFRLANAALQTRAHALLVTILFFCAKQPLAAITDGGVSDEPRIHLEPSNLRKVLHSRHRLCQLARSKTLWCVFFEDHLCHNGNCNPTRVYFLRRTLEQEDIDGFLDPFNKFEEMDSLPSWCQSCREGKRNRILQGRQEAWQELPKVFGFESWDTLTDENA